MNSTLEDLQIQYKNREFDNTLNIVQSLEGTNTESFFTVFDYMDSTHKDNLGNLSFNINRNSNESDRRL